MRVNREELLKILESVTPGLATREIIEQSSCLVFTDGLVQTFNDEISCSRKSPLKISGAVKAMPLIQYLSKLSEDDVDIEPKDGELIVSGKRRKAGIRMEQEVMLPVDAVDIPDKWEKLNPEFSEAVSIVHACASTEEATFSITCVHVHPDYLEASDRFQIARYPIKTGVKEEVLVRAASLKKILGLDMTEISETSSWMHFRNPAGLIMSVRRWAEEDYADLSDFLSKTGSSPITLPGGLEEVVQKAEIFSGENANGNHVIVNLRADRLVIEGEGASGWAREMKAVKYTGEPVKFLIAPKLLLEVSKKSKECSVSNGRLFIDGGKYQYVTCTVVPEEKDFADDGQGEDAKEETAAAE